MIDVEVAPVARRVVEDLGEVTADEEVLVLAEPMTVDVARMLAVAARGAGATTTLSVMSQLPGHGVEPPAVIGAGMRAADAVFMATEHSLTHTRARIEAANGGTRVAVLRGVTEEMLIDGAMTADFDAIRETTTAVCDALAAADEVAMTAPAGTDVTLSIANRPTFPLDGFFHDYGFSNLPPGLAVTSPVEGSAAGTIVLDFSMDTIGRIEDPVELDFEDGSVAEIRGGAEAGHLRELLADAGDGAGNLAEFAVGTNPAARLTGSLAEDKKKQGIVDIAVGDNTSIGGTVAAAIHLDAVVRRPTVALDGTTVIEGGTLDLGAVRTLTGQ